MTELWRMGATELAARIRAREVSSREVVEAHLARIEAVNPRINAVTVVLAESARAAADAADAAVRAGTATGPLHGVPMTVKENLDVAGSATTYGLTVLRNAIATADGPLVASVRRAGAIPIGRTNMPEFGARWHTENALWGATRNPWSAEHTPGASSGGEAAALAAGLSPLGLGNDGAGSLRWPAQCCGVTALKPSFARVPLVSLRATAQPVPLAFQLLAVHGPMARHVRDLRTAFAPMCVPSVGDPWHIAAPVEGPPLERPLRVAVAEDPGGLGVHPDIATAVRRAAAALADAGYAVEPRDPPALVRASEIYTQIMTRFGRTTEELPSTTGLVGDQFQRFWDAWNPVWAAACGARVYDPVSERASLASAWGAFLAETPLLLAPIATQPAFRLDAELDPERLAGWPTAMRMIVAVNLLGLPAVAVPAGEANRLPQGVQVIGPRFREDLCLEAAEAIESRLGTLTPIDPRS
jgi:amidase